MVQLCSTDTMQVGCKLQCFYKACGIWIAVHVSYPKTGREGGKKYIMLYARFTDGSMAGVDSLVL